MAHDERRELSTPGAEALTEKLEDIIQRHGHAVVFTEEITDTARVPMAYTVGLAAAGLAEIVVFGLPSEVSQVLLNDAAQRLRRDELPVDEKIERLASMPVVFKRVPPVAAEQHIMMANNRAGQPVEALQLVWPDQQSRFPWEEAFDEQCAKAQPLLFARAH